MILKLGCQNVFAVSGLGLDLVLPCLVFIDISEMIG